LEKTVVSSKIIPESELNRKDHGNQRNTIFTEPVDLLELVSYQEGAVISRTLFTSKCGTVTLFAFDQGQGLTEHVSLFDALVEVLDGTVEISVSGKPMQLNKGQIMTLLANQPHALTGLSKFKMLLIMIRSH
jgi:quercetin dioxygenase-like cupin family protein